MDLTTAFFFTYLLNQYFCLLFLYRQSSLLPLFFSSTSNCWGKLMMSLRNWMVRYIQYRFAKEHWDANKRRMVTGTWREVANSVMIPMLNDLKYVTGKLAQTVTRNKIEWIANLDLDSMSQNGFPLKTIIQNCKNKDYSVYSDSQKEAMVGAMSELAVVGLVKFLAFSLYNWYDEQEIPDTWYERMICYGILRAKTEAETFTPAAGLSGFQSTLKSVKTTMPIISVLMSLMNLETAIVYQQDEVLKSGKYEGMTKVEKALYKSLLLPVKQVDDFHATFFEGDNSKFDYLSKDNLYFQMD